MFTSIDEVLRRPIEFTALPLISVIVAGLIVTIAGNWLWALVFYHVVGGGLWTGIDLFVGFVIGPILGRLSIPARAEFSARFMPMMVVIMPTVVLMVNSIGRRNTSSMEVNMGRPAGWMKALTDARR